MNHTQKIISKLPLVDLNGLDWTVEPEAIYIQEHRFSIEAGEYEVLASAYLEMIDERIYFVPNCLEVFENTEDGWAIIDLSDEDYAVLSRAINDVIQ